MKPWRGLKELPRDMWVLAFATLINRAGVMVLPFLTIYLTGKLNLPADQAGLVLAVYGGGSLLSAPFSGKISDKIGAMNVMKISLIASGFILFLYTSMKDFQLILLITAIWSIISEAFRPANLSLIAEVVLPEQRRTAFALNRLAINLGMSIGPVIGGFLMLIDYNIIFIVDGCTSIIAGFFLIFSKLESVYNKDAAKEISHLPSESKIKFAVLKDKKYLYFLLGIIPIQMIFFQHLGAMPLFLVQDLGYLPAVFGLLAGINTVLIILFEIPLINSISHWSDHKSLAIGAMLFAVGFGAMAFAQEIIFISITIIIWTFGEMILFPVSANYAADSAPANRRGEYMGFYQVTFSLAFALGPWMGNVVYEYNGPQMLWISTLIVGLISALILYRVEKPIIKNIGINT
jgi:MFS family permease